MGNVQRRNRSLSNEAMALKQSPSNFKNRKLSSGDYQSRKDQILMKLKQAYEIKMNNMPLYTNLN